MTVYSFFIITNKTENYEFMRDHSHCMKENYKGFHPVIRQQDGSFQILYAMTTSKRMKNIFMETRKMNKFVYYKSNIESEVYKSMKKELDDMVLVEDNLSTYDMDTMKISDIPTILTKYELSRILDESFIIEELLEIFRPNDEISLLEYDLFKRNIDSLFNFIKLNPCIDLINFGANDSDIAYYEDDFYRILKLISKDTVLKTFDIFIKLFGNLLNI